MQKYVRELCEDTVYEFKFEDTIELCNYVKHARINRKIFPRGTKLASDCKDEDGWYQTKNLREAIKLCENGWNEGYTFFKTLKKSLEMQGDKIYYFLTNEYGFVNLYVDLSYNYKTTKQMVVNRGVIIQNLITQLESNGYHVRLNAFAFSITNHEICSVRVGLKDKDEELNPEKVYFALCNPSFLRRIIFRVMESADFKDENWQHGYGYTYPPELLRWFYDCGDYDILIPEAHEMRLTGGRIGRDWRKFLAYEELQDYFNP